MPSRQVTQLKSSALDHQRGTPLSDSLLPLQSRIAKLTWGERLDILDAWTLVLDGTYAHLPLKQALYGFDPIRAIEHLRQQVPTLSDIVHSRRSSIACVTPIPSTPARTRSRTQSRPFPFWWKRTGLSINAIM